MRNSISLACITLLCSTQAMAWSPNDPYFKPIPVWGGSSIVQPKRQWGLSAMNFEGGWNTTRGNAYLGIVDGGMPGNMEFLRYEYSSRVYSFEVHEDIGPNYRIQFSRTPYLAEVDAIAPLDKHVSWHATHVAGIAAAQGNNNLGITGACPSCSLAAFPLASGSAGLYSQGLDSATAPSLVADAMTRAIQAGMQVINWSGELPDDENHTLHNCSQPSLAPICTALDLLKSRDVLLVQSSGNFSKTNPPFPSNIDPNNSTVLAVAGTSSGSPERYSGNLTAGSLWTKPAAGNGVGSSWAGIHGVVAPADGIVSTVPHYPGTNADYLTEYQCGDYAGDTSAAGEPARIGDGYGTCSGTSMAAPHVTGLAGLIRSINPLLSAKNVRQIIQNSGNQANNRSSELGYGLPNAGTAVNLAVNTNPSKLTPLFAFYSTARLDSFYTSVPQMATAALTGNLEPRPHCSISERPFTCNLDVTLTPYSSFYGAPVTNWGSNYGAYTQFPGVSTEATKAPLAEAWVFTTPANPKSATVSLVPLIRMSWKCESASTGGPACSSTNGFHTDTTYTTEDSGVESFKQLGYQVDGVEGYIYPKTVPQPAGTVRLMRKYNPARDDHAIFPESKLAYMTSLGYTENSGSDWLGYVYPNSGGVPTVQ